MKYEIIHTTAYRYGGDVSVSHHVAHLIPRAYARQTCVSHDLQIDPLPGVMSSHEDYFGNPTTFFAMQAAHTRLDVRVRSVVEVVAPDLPAESPPWEDATDRSAMPLEAIEYAVDSRAQPAAGCLRGLCASFLSPKTGPCSRPSPT